MSKLTRTAQSSVARNGTPTHRSGPVATDGVEPAAKWSPLRLISYKRITALMAIGVLGACLPLTGCGDDDDDGPDGTGGSGGSGGSTPAVGGRGGSGGATPTPGGGGSGGASGGSGGNPNTAGGGGAGGQAAAGSGGFGGSDTDIDAGPLDGGLDGGVDAGDAG
jgi:hypothetical protein